jgi:uncharacterized protein
MEVSGYCDLIEDRNGRWLAFSTTTGSACVVDGGVRAAILAGDVSKLSPGQATKLYRMGLLVASREQERQQISDRLRSYREASDAIRYTLLTTYGCNLRCAYCYEDAIGSRQGTMRLAVAEAVVARIKQDLKQSGAKQVGITLYGGEPLLNIEPGMHVLRELAKCRNDGPFSLQGAIISNGTLFTDEMTAELAPYVQFAQVTFDGGPAFHDTIRFMHGRVPTFDRICESIKRLIRQGVRVMIRIQVTKESAPSLDGCFQRLKEHGLLGHDLVRSYFFPIIDIAGVCSSRSFRCGHEYFEPALFEQLWEYGPKYGVMITAPPVPVWVSPYCSFVSRWAKLIDPNGRIFKCVAEVGREDAVIGSVFDSTAEQVQQQRQREARFVERSGLSFEKCRSCSYLPLCDGGCAYMARCGDARCGGDGSPDTPSCELHLRPMRAWMQHTLQTMAHPTLADVAL